MYINLETIAGISIDIGIFMIVYGIGIFMVVYGIR